MRPFDDPRWPLVPASGSRCLYFHAEPAEGIDDHVAGPFSAPPDAPVIRRQPARPDAGLEFRPYEAVAFADNQEVHGSRAGILGRFHHCGPPSLTLHERFGQARIDIDRLLSRIFETLICSMARIVVSAALPDCRWAMVSCRDSAKLSSIPAYCYIRRDDDALLWRGPATGSGPSSSALMCARFHEMFERPAILFHCHAVFPVLWDSAFERAPLIEAPPRSEAFGERLATLLRDNHVAQRRGEGLWSASPDWKLIADRCAWAQAQALERLQAARANHR